jgi:predicted DNA-binding protein (MmcQ/YjbR family)
MSLEEDALERLREIRLKLPETEETVTFGNPTFRAGKKTFAVLEWYRGELSLAVKSTLIEQEMLVKDPRFYITPYIGHRGWVSLRVTAATDWEMVQDLVLDSYRRVANKRMLARLAAAAGSGHSRAAGGQGA